MKKIYLTTLASFLSLGSLLHAQMYINKIVFSLPSSVAGSDSVCTINPDGSAFTFITNGARPRVANNKNTVAFLQGNQSDRSTNNIYFKEGSNAPFVFFDNSSVQSITNFDFTPNDYYFIYDWDHGLYFTESNNPNGQSFGGSCSGDLVDNFPRVSPTDSATCQTSPTHGLYLMPSLQNGCDKIPNTVGNERSPYWSADGQWIYFLKTHTAGEGNHNIYKIKRDGTSLTQITNFSLFDTLGMSLVITKNGRWALAPARMNGVVGIYKFRLDSPNNFGYLVKDFNYLNSPMGTIWLGSVDSVSDDMSMSIIEMDDIAVSAYPNPSTDFVRLHLDKNITGVLRLYNMAGTLLREDKMQNTNTYLIDMRELPNGVYLLQGITDGKLFTQRIIKQ